MNQNEINKILAVHNLRPQVIKKLNVGFTNLIYQLDDDYILKICDEENSTPFRNESKFYKYFQNKLPVPEIKAYGDHPLPYMIYRRIEGENLYNVWHTLTNDQRKTVIKQLCSYLKIINESEPPKDIELHTVASWHEDIVGRIDGNLAVAEKMGTLTADDASAVRRYINKYSACLDNQVIALVYWDVHFDNFLVINDKIVGFLDLEHIEYASIDFVLDTVKKMVDFPKKYASEHAEQFIKDEDYVNLLDLYKDSYPKLFDFPNMDRRLELYGLAHDLKDLKNWPQAQQLKDNIRITANRL